MNTSSVRYPKKPIATADSLNNRYIISPLSIAGDITVSAVLRSIKESTHLSWRDIADWCGIRDSSDAFKLAYTRSLRKERARLSEYITISGDLAYFYDKDHKPTSPVAVVKHASLINGERDIISAVVNRASKFATRVTVLDTEDRALKLTLTATNGYISSIDNDVTIQNKAQITVTGDPKRLNAVLRGLVIVCPTAGEASVKLVLDDLTGGVSALSTAEIPILVEQAKTASIPSLNTPATAGVKLTADSVLTPAVTVSDADNKEFELHITPFGCNIFGFKNSIHAVTPGTMYVTAGTPDEINADIAKMSVYAYQTNAQIAYELVWDTTKIRKYLALTVSDGESEKPTTTTDTADVGETKDTTQKVESTVDDATVDDE